MAELFNAYEYERRRGPTWKSWVQRNPACVRWSVSIVVSGLLLVSLLLTLARDEKGSVSKPVTSAAKPSASHAASLDDHIQGDWVHLDGVESVIQDRLKKEVARIKLAEQKKAREEVAARLGSAPSKPAAAPTAPTTSEVIDKNRFVSEKQQQVSRATEYFTLTNFSYCDMLDGVTVQGHVYLPVLQGSLSTANPSRSEVSQIIDDVARRVAERVQSVEVFNHPHDAFAMEQLKRFGCFSAITGDNDYAFLSEGVFLERLPSVRYFPQLSLLPASAKPPTDTHRNRLAYIITVHQAPRLLDRLIPALAGPDVAIMINTEYHDSKDFSQEIAESVKRVQHLLPASMHIYIASHVFPTEPHSSSVVFSELEAMFELAQHVTFDWIMRITEYDYPLRTPEAILTMLDAHGPDVVHMSILADDAHVISDLRHVAFPVPSHEFSVVFNEGPERNFPWPHRYHPALSSSHFILPYSFVHFLRTDPHAHAFMAWIEHSLHPDMTFWATVARSDPVWSARIRPLPNGRFYGHASDGQHHTSKPLVDQGADPYDEYKSEDTDDHGLYDYGQSARSISHNDIDDLQHHRAWFAMHVERSSSIKREMDRIRKTESQADIDRYTAKKKVANQPDSTADTLRKLNLGKKVKAKKRSSRF
ncbi:hypothetical protein CXG81DRAFT_20724 [Caulochytrium protostelioides]|nr:hypothetical protein CXG81DRAFT_20724 [Caulochytrium protostelioides]|eukprot:RKO99165.1 hypothetical protein CXG81DRAFT_20724 [Caulochytrium protostelioides]